MKVGRRAFIGFIAGAIGGTLLSPLPWKLTDDIAIWTQNWSWRPSPKRGHRAGKKTLCNLCGGACGIEVDLIDEKRAIYVRGTNVNPLNKGGLCSIGASAVQYLYAPYRIAQPLKQTKKRGDISGFKPISWEEALGEISKKLLDLKRQGNSKAIACISGQKNSSMFALWNHFFKAYGSKNVFSLPDERDGWKLACLSIFGIPQPCGFDLSKVNYLLSFGAEWADGWGSLSPTVGMVSHLMEAKAGQPLVDIVHVSSRISMSATKAREWIPVKPSTEAALALGMASIMVKENLISSDVLSFRGFEKWVDSSGKERKGFKEVLLKEYSSEKVSEITGVEKGKIFELARAFATTPGAIAIWGSNGSPNSFYNDLAFIALNLLKGNFSDEGLCYLQSDPPLTSLPEVEENQSDSIKRLDEEAGWSLPLAPYSNAIYPFLDALSSGKGYPIKVLFIQEANPLFTLAEKGLVEEALGKVDTVVVMSSFMDESAAFADIILPSPTMLERWDDVCNVPNIPNPVYAISAPVIKARLDVKHPGDVLIQLAKNLDESIKKVFPWKNYTEFLKFRAKGIVESKQGTIADGNTDLSDRNIKPNYSNLKHFIAKLSEGRIWYDYPEPLSTRIKTASGKPEFVISAFEGSQEKPKKDELFFPAYTEIKPAGDKKEYPLLLSGYSTNYIASSYIPNSYLMMKDLWDFQLKGNMGFVEINPATAKEFGFKEGTPALLKTLKGETKVFVHITPSVPEKVIYMVKGLGHKAYDEYVKGKGINIRELIEVQVDPITGLGIEGPVRAKLVRL